MINPANTSQVLYRTGDLVSCNADGNLLFAGRVDDQIKLRGFRIELNEIETVMMQHAGVKQAIVSLQALEQPTLVAYLLLDTHNEFDLCEFKSFLKARLPDYMLPSLVEVLTAFPVLPSGKVNKKELPKPSQNKTERLHRAPDSDLARNIARVWEKAFACTDISVDADFFYDLGGHSLHAAKVISNLRQVPALKNISILDLYKNPTIEQLAKKFGSAPVDAAVNLNQTQKEKYRAPQWNYYLCGVGQFFGCLMQYALGTLQLLAVILCYSWVSSEYSIISRESQLAFLALFLSMPIISLLITIALKWILLGRVKPGEYPLWGWFYSKRCLLLRFACSSWQFTRGSYHTEKWSCGRAWPAGKYPVWYFALSGRCVCDGSLLFMPHSGHFPDQLLL